MLTYRATLDVPVPTAARVSRWIQAHRRRYDTRPWQRAATTPAQAVLVLRWLKEGTAIHLLARDAEASQATAYRYLREAVDVIAAHAPDLPEVLTTGRQAGWAFVALDAHPHPTTRSAVKSAAGHDLWYSGKHHRHGGSIQVLTAPTGFPLWTCPVEPGSVHDLTAARTHALAGLYRAACLDLPTLADKGYTAAGIGVHVPLKGRQSGRRQPRQEPAAHRPARPRRTRQRPARTAAQPLVARAHPDRGGGPLRPPEMRAGAPSCDVSRTAAPAPQ